MLNEAEKYAEGEEVKLSGEALPALNKAFNMAQAVMNTAQGVSKALATANAN